MINNSFSTANSMAAASAIMLQAGLAITDSNRQQQAQKEPEVYNLSSGLFPCVCVAMYETLLSPQVFEDNINEDEEEFCYITVDFDDWKKSLTEAAQDYLRDSIIDVLRDYGLLDIKAASIWSPLYYNFQQDELIMDVTMQQDWQNIMAAKVAEWQDREDVKEYISKNWRSFSGYVNFMPESLALVLTEEDEERQLAAYLTLALVAEGVNLDCGDIMEDLYYRMDDFSDYSRINVIEECYNDNAEAWELLDTWKDDTRWDMLYWSLFERIGSPWSRQEESKELRSREDPSVRFHADSDGKRMLFWAAKQGLTIQELDDLASGAIGLEEVYYNHLS